MVIARAGEHRAMCAENRQRGCKVIILGQSESQIVTASSLPSCSSREKIAVFTSKSSVRKPNLTGSQQYLYFTSNTVESSSSSSSSLRGAISTRSAGVVIMSYFLVFLILLPDLKQRDGKGRIVFIQCSLKLFPPTPNHCPV